MTERAWMVLVPVAVLALGCNRVASGSDETDTEESGSTGDGDGDDGPLDDEGPKLDNDEDHGCPIENCNLVDLLFLVDNSAGMGEEQRVLSASLPLLMEMLSELTDHTGGPLQADVNIMFTTTDVGHPECTPLEPEGYVPAQGAPQSEACIERLDDFTMSPEACTSGCPLAVEPADPFIHIEGSTGVTNVPGNDVEGALRCIGPQGTNGCGYEAPLEAMLLAIDPDATWNLSDTPFLREHALLAIVIITDEEDCSVRAPEGYAYFTDPMQNTYWQVNPDTGTKTNPSSAVCWNAGVDCGAPDANGVYADCHSNDTGVLHPVDRYLTYLRDELIGAQSKKVVMVGVLGVPHVTQHNPQPPYQPIDGGVAELVYRDWVDGPYPLGDIIEVGETAASKQFEFGIGPGCTGEDGMGGFIGQAIPPVRIKEVCQGLDDLDRTRCCIQSVCDDEYPYLFHCLGGLIQDSLTPIEEEW
jgi:hypothetical protein